NEELETKLQNADDLMLHHGAAALRHGIPVQQIYKLSSIDPWFIEKIRNIVEAEKKLTQSQLDTKTLHEAKKLGFSDKQIGRLVSKDDLEIRKIRKEAGIVPVVKQVDTLAE